MDVNAIPVQPTQRDQNSGNGDSLPAPAGGGSFASLLVQSAQRMGQGRMLATSSTLLSMMASQPMPAPAAPVQPAPQPAPSTQADTVGTSTRSPKHQAAAVTDRNADQNNDQDDSGAPSVSNDQAPATSNPSSTDSSSQAQAADTSSDAPEEKTSSHSDGQDGKDHTDDGSDPSALTIALAAATATPLPAAQVTRPTMTDTPAASASATPAQTVSSGTPAANGTAGQGGQPSAPKAADQSTDAGGTPLASLAGMTAANAVAAKGTIPAGAKVAGQTAATAAAANAAQVASAAGQASGQTGSVAAQAAGLSQIAGSTPVSVKTDSGHGVSAQSSVNLVPGAALADQPAIAVLPPDQQGFGSGNGSGGDQAFGQQAQANPQAAPAAPQSPSPALAADAQAVFSLSAAGAASAATSAGAAAVPNQMTAQAVGQVEQVGAANNGGQPAQQQTAMAAPASVQGATPAQEAEAPSAPQSVRQPALPPTEQIKVQIEKGVKSGADTISVQLSPDNLGKVEVKLEVQDGQVKATVTADRPETLQLLKNDAAGLQQSLQDAGLKTDANSLSFQLRGDQERQAQQQQQNNGREFRRGRMIEFGDDDTTVSATQATTRSRASASAGGVDISV